ncbi:MAG: glutamate racemase [Candidatus Doudnabacteria bacterium RIFCSPHIGHO2_02_FULL_48_21]|uniref:Glutamate racemase n=1 Tax=Candidatus Doudnabacteria bacterium RIFCSPLOWO2_02_FULL_48_13 TaxID=1817845 RepID=A0A1F5Q8T4_9BACT|nr:MAG: glutamate racemase [Candidatus Doudnabacteria bacterium RIFCSPHIGHO2_01_48_18]OGE78472.1 MAG: glutamate racemase [Candidatus Doudnabacteria bacterium RIFCSPHIGHO2_01_FULL_48_180]OGE90992.1 MAG: glutamate racemase [Candidatus Doudnabacteria bacterium RIFCSPHIGHO2_12_FULL_47_25]OGE93914.1 MAG: glutamate racemase [Candidatus Doudnabacteria bacterium RIFCSPHIGHO2_02_FULL_48_21]OGE97675.1 MAG: glutamate racemase [Candidatus Doudnabacteria bacterium RIFCSPLOWO2_01_FULL_48_57]OGE98595.1 MAG: 
MKMAEKFIGVFDSGFGGLNTMRGIVRMLPQYNYIYLGDSARAPYGHRSKKQVYEFTTQAVDFLFKNNCELVVLACNTASSDALRKIQKEYLPKHYPHKKVLGVLIPAVEHGVSVTKNKRIGVMATIGTVKSKAFEREMQKLDPEIKVLQQACPLLVPLVEEGKHNSKAAEAILKKYVSPLADRNIDTLLLGCTHYGILEKQIKKHVGKNVQVISETNAVPSKLKDYLKRHKDIANKIGRNKKILFYSTGPISKFEKLGSKFFGSKIKVTGVDLN